MQRQLAAFVEHPSKATFLAARDAVLCLSPLPLLATDLAELEQLAAAHRYEALLDRIDALPPSKVLSPSIHFWAAEAAAALADESQVELERWLFVIALQGLLATGDGTPDSPYVVCHPTDEYDVLATLGLSATSQSLVEREGQLCDVLQCADGREVWFDVTDVLVAPCRRRRVPAQRRAAARRRQRISRLHR